jgi:hypothetical protein
MENNCRLLEIETIKLRKLYKKDLRFYENMRKRSNLGDMYISDSHILFIKGEKYEY